MRAIRLHNQQFQLDHNYPLPSIEKDEVWSKFGWQQSVALILNWRVAIMISMVCPVTNLWEKLPRVLNKGRVVADINIGCCNVATAKMVGFITAASDPS